MLTKPIKLSFMDRLLKVVEGKKPSDRVVLRFLLFATLASGIYYLISINDGLVISTPTQGGSLTEGIVGIPRFVNPALAITRADQDTAALVYNGLLKIDENGQLVPDLAESITTSEDGTEYTIVLKKDRFFSDGQPVTASDVLFTIELIRDPDLKSPLRGNWNDVTLKEVDEYEFKVVLTEAYFPFIENFTVGIMPKHIWSNLPIEQLPFSQYNTEPIGSGPFAITKVNRDVSGLISGYVLKPSETQTDTKPNLASIELKFYQNETLLLSALESGQINSTVFLPTDTTTKLNSDRFKIISLPLPRIFGIFINQNRSIALRDKSARAALSSAIDRDKIVEEVLGGYGVPTTKPIVTEHRTLLLADTALNEEATTTPFTAEEILIRGGWKKNNNGLWEKKIDQGNEILAVTIRTGNSDLFNKVANMVAEDWRRLGVEVQVEQYEQTGLVQSVIRSRDFQALLFGLDMNRLQDLYPFWHSSQKDDPGLNISQYTNVTVDRLLEQAKTTQDENEQQKILNEISDIITSETPAIFLFAPSLTYVIDREIQNAPMTRLGKPADRFMNIANWHARTDIVWPIFQ